MSKTKRQVPSEGEELGALLRLGDPAGGASGPCPAELARMRVAILAAADAPPRRRFAPAPLPALAAAALAAAAVLAVVAWVARRGPVAALPPEPALTSAQWIPAVPESLLEGPAAAPAPPRAASAAPSAPRAMTVRFTTRRGTQIIWTLDPRIEL